MRENNLKADLRNRTQVCLFVYVEKIKAVFIADSQKQ